MAYGETSAKTDAIKVFVSYSRADTDFALDLVAALQACGFEAFIDQEDIAPGEPWEQRLTGLIESADTIVYVLSPDSLSSEHCTWEVNETLRLNKRLLPVVWRAVADEAVPPTLSQLNYTFFSGKNSFAAGLKELSAALRVDYGWIREHTRIGALARRWDNRGRTEALLLRGDELEAAASWANTRPSGAPELSDGQIDFIAASKAAHDAAERAIRNRRRGLLAAVSVVAIAMAGLAGYGLWQAQQAKKAEEFAVEAYEMLTETNDSLQAAFIRLSVDLALKAPPTGREPLSIPGGWFPLAANYSGSVVRLTRTESSTRQIITGVLLKGDVIHPDMAGDTFLLSPLFKSEEVILAEDRRLDAFLNATDRRGASGAEDFRGERFSRSAVIPRESEPLAQSYVDEIATSEEPDILFKAFVEELDPAEPVEPMDNAYLDEVGSNGSERAGDIMEQRAIIPDAPADEAGTAGTVAVSFPILPDAPPLTLDPTPYWRTPIELAAASQFALYRIDQSLPFGLRALEATDIACTGQDQFSTDKGLVALFGIDGLAAKGQSVGEELTLLVTDKLGARTNGDITYRHATLKGAYGAPVFDVETGKVIGIHQGVIVDEFGPRGRLGLAEPLSLLIDRIRDDVSIEREDETRSEPLCGLW